MNTIYELFVDKKYSTSRWDVLSLSDTHDEKFLVMLIPVMEYVLTTLEKFIAANPNLANVNENFLFNQVKKDLTYQFKWMLSRVCVLEMHLARMHSQLQGDTPTARFSFFIELLRNPDYAASILDKYPLLSEKITIFVDQYIHTQIELFSRLANDKDELYSIFLDNDYSFLLEQIHSSGDKHNQGRSVAILVFSNGKEHKKIVYKPRSLAIDVVFQNFVIWVNQFLTETKLFIPDILAKNQYGWYAFLVPETCQNSTEIEHYYQRMGHLLMIVHLLGASDLHYENIIAHGEFPIIIDYECFLRPSILDHTPSRHFVTDTHFLPGKMLAHKGYSGFDISAFGGVGGEEALYRSMEWEQDGTDEMRLVRLKKTVPSSNNIPSLRGKSITDPFLYQESFVQGFVNMYKLMLAQLPLLNSEQSPLCYFKNAETRVVLRNTSDYGKLLVESYHPFLLQSSEKRSAHFAWLKANYQDQTLLDAMISSEIHNLETGNIPAFYCVTDERAIFDSDRTKLALTVSLSGWEYLQWHITHYLNEDDLFLQTHLINNAFIAQRPMASPSTKIPSESALILVRSNLDYLAKLHIINREHIFWAAVEESDKQWHATFTDINLYNGVAGISLAFAYGGAILNDESYTRLARLGYNSILRTIAERKEKSFDNVGAFSGLAGIIYTFHKLYLLWNDSSIRDELIKLCHYIPNLLEKDTHFDIISGAAGCLVVLLGIKDEIGENLIFPYIEQCVAVILRQYPTPNQIPLMGFSHGAAGFAWALAQYYDYSPNHLMKEWIQQALMHERAHFSADANNWADLRDGRNHFKSAAWCHGAPGIGLARVDMQDYFQDEYFENEIASAVKNLQSSPLHVYQGLCHGNLGNVEVLLQLSLQQPHQYQDVYHSYMESILEDIRSNGARCELVPLQCTPGLMTGMAGIAYQLLRITYPEKVPSVLLLK